MTGTVRAAAEKMTLTQPAISKQIAGLERELSMKLFHRTPSGMILTAAGEALYEMGGDVLTRFERAEQTMRSRFSGKAAVRVACPHATGATLLTAYMVDANPPIVDLFMVPASDVDRYLEGEADLGIGTLRPAAHRQQMEVAIIPVTVQGTTQAMQARFGESHVGNLEELSGTLVIVPLTGVYVAIEQAVSSFREALTIRSVATGSVGQALAANNHGLVLATEQPAHGLCSLPVYAHGQPVAVTLFASWDGNHYAATDLRAIALDFSKWWKSAAPWNPGSIGS